MRTSKRIVRLNEFLTPDLNMRRCTFKWAEPGKMWTNERKLFEEVNFDISSYIKHNGFVAETKEHFENRLTVFYFNLCDREERRVNGLLQQLTLTTASEFERKVYDDAEIERLVEESKRKDAEIERLTTPAYQSNIKRSMSSALHVPLGQLIVRVPKRTDVFQPAMAVEKTQVVVVASLPETIKAVQSDVVVAQETMQQAIHHLIHVMHAVNIDSNAMLTMLNAQLPQRESKAVKKSVPRNVKIAVWNRWIGEELGKAPCWCCGVASIDKGIGWHCGHVVAEIDGGESDVSNMRPVCAGCNLGMGTQNMLGYMQRHYRDRFAQMQQ